MYCDRKGYGGDREEDIDGVEMLTTRATAMTRKRKRRKNEVEGRGEGRRSSWLAGVDGEGGEESARPAKQQSRGEARRGDAQNTSQSLCGSLLS